MVAALIETFSDDGRPEDPWGKGGWPERHIAEGDHGEGDRVEGGGVEGDRVEGGGVEGGGVEGDRVEGDRVEGARVERGRDLFVVAQPPAALRSDRAALRPQSVPSPAVIRRRRLVVGGVAGAILLGLVLGLQALFGRPGGGPLASVGSPAAAEPAVARVWVVRPGDTVWSIALASGAKGDIRPLVARLSAEVGGRPLQPGERIRVP